MSAATALAEAAAADAAADNLFAQARSGAAARTEEARAIGEVLMPGEVYMFGCGQGEIVERASDLRRRAQALRNEVAEAVATHAEAARLFGVAQRALTQARPQEAAAAASAEASVTEPPLDPVGEIVARILGA